MRRAAAAWIAEVVRLSSSRRGTRGAPAPRAAGPMTMIHPPLLAFIVLIDIEFDSSLSDDTSMRNDAPPTCGTRLHLSVLPSPRLTPSMLGDAPLKPHIDHYESRYYMQDV